MQPRRLTGLPGNFSAGAGLALYLAARCFASLLLALLLSANAFAGSNVIQYTYDPVGNITNIARQSTGGLAITSFTPTSAPVGTAVTIYGAGFSATPANNTVTFNGTAATVTASDAGSIATTVPSGATTGRISVQVGASTVYSAQDFIVTIAGAPTIASFTPTIGAAGTSVSVSGTNFNATSGATTLSLNGVAASGGASSTTAATFTVPASASSGRVSATTSVGTGMSTSDFIVPPQGLSASAIESVIRITANGGNSNIAVGTANKSGLVLFNGTASTYYSLHFRTLETSPTSINVDYQVIKPDTSVLVSGTVSIGPSSPSLHLPPLPTTGTYTLVLSPGIATLNTMVRLEANPVLLLDGGAAATAQDYNNQSSRFVFSATAGQRVGIGVMGLSFFPSGVAVTPSYTKPDGSSFTLSLSSCDAAIAANTAANCDNEFVADQTGTYTVKVPSGQTFYSSASIQLNSTVSGTLTADSTQSISLTRVGQDAAYTFTGSVGDSVGIDLTATSLSPQTSSISVAIEKPDGSTLTSCPGTPPAGIYCDAGTLSTAGTYTATVDPAYGNYGALKLTLKQGPMLATSDPPTSFSTATASESARARFTATAGQNLGVAVSGLTYPGGGSGSSTLIVYKPDRSQAGTVTCDPATSSGNCAILLTNLPAGTYGVVLRPPSGVKMSGNFAVSSDATGTLTAGTAQTVTTTRVGQRVVYTFAGTTGDNIAIEIYGLTTTPANETVYLYLYGPSGNYLDQTSLWRGGAYVNRVLTSTGPHTVVLEPNHGAMLTAQLLLDAGTAITVDGSTATLATSYAGQPLRYRFSGTSGQALDFGVYGLGYTVSSSNTTGFTIYKPDGNSLASGSCTPSSTGSCDYSTTSLPSTGTYAVMFAPYFASIVNAGTLALSTPVAGTFVVGNPAQTVSVSRAGQTARYTFSGTSGQTLKITYNSVSVAGGGSLAMTVLNPSGTTLTSATVPNGGNSFFNVTTLPTNGTYTVVFDPPSGTTMSGSFSLVTQ